MIIIKKTDIYMNLEPVKSSLSCAYSLVVFE